MAVTNYTTFDPNVSFLTKSSEVHNGLESNLVLISALLAFVKTSLVRESYRKQLALSQAHHRVVQAVSLLSECEYPAARELIEGNQTGTALATESHHLIREIIDRGPKLPSVSEELITNITLQSDQDLVAASSSFGEQVFYFYLVASIYLLTAFVALCVISRVLGAKQRDIDRQLALAKQSKSDIDWVRSVEKRLEAQCDRLTLKTRDMADAHQDIGNLLRNYQRFFRESAEQLSRIDCSAIKSTAAACYDNHVQTITTLIQMIDGITDHRNALQRNLVNIARRLPQLGKLGRLLADRIAIAVPELAKEVRPGTNDDDDDASPIEMPTAMPLLSVSVATTHGGAETEPSNGNGPEGNVCDSSEQMDQENWEIDSNPWLRPPITPLPRTFKLNESHGTGQEIRWISLVGRMRHAERNEVTGVGRKILDLCGRAVWRGIAETATLTLKPIELKGKTIELLRSCRGIFTTDQDTDCPAQHLPDSVCDWCLKRVLCSYHCLVCELAIELVAEWYGIRAEMTDHPSVIHDVAYHQLILQGKPPSRSRAVYPYERGEMSYGDKVGARSRIYEPADDVVSNSALNMYNLHRLCEGCTGRHAIVSRKRGALRRQEMSYHTWFARHHQEEAGSKDGWDDAEGKQFGPLLPADQCSRYDNEAGLEGSGSYNVTTGEIIHAPAPFTDQPVDQEAEDDQEPLEESSLIRPGRGSLIIGPGNVFELPGEVRSRMSLRSKIESILETTL